MIKRNSWHYWLASFGNWRMDGREQIDFCTYFWYVIGGLFRVIGVFLAVILAVIWVAYSFYDLYNWVLHNIPMRDMAILFIASLCSCLILCGTAFGFMKYHDYKVNLEYKEVEPGFFTLAYHKFKDKTCMMMKVSD